MPDRASVDTVCGLDAGFFKEREMKRISKIGILSLTVLSFATASAGFANASSPDIRCGPGAAGGFGRGAHMRGGDPSALAKSHLAAMKAALIITPRQEPAWDAFAGKVKAQAASMAAMRGRAAQMDVPAPERMAQRTAFMRERLAGMEAMSGAMKDLYATLTPEQKATFDNMTSRRRARPMGMHFGRGAM